MKKFKYAIISVLAAFSLAGCNYLDVDPELGLTDEQVFSSYKNFSSYFMFCYSSQGGKNKGSILFSFPMYYDLNINYRLCYVCTTDAADCGAVDIATRNFKQCNLTQDILERITFSETPADAKPLAYAMFHMIRQANLTIERIDECKNITQQQYDDLLGQCYAIRGYCHFILARQFGGMPYIQHTLGADDEWDLPRESSHTTFVKAAEDLKTGYEYLKKAGYVRRDAKPGQPGHLTSSTMNQISGATAMAIRARALLYAASPLSNELGEEDWKVAAEACAEALKIAEEQEYELLPFEHYTDNYYGKEATNECLWSMIGNGSGTIWKDNYQNYVGFFAYPQSHYQKAAGTCPTQNFVDKFETIDGYALNTPEDREKATKAGSYNDQDPYCLAPGTTRGRDPRFANAVVYDGSTNDFVDGKINIHYDPAIKAFPFTVLNGENEAFAIEWGTMDNDAHSYTNTGYYCNKYWTGCRGDKMTAAQPKLDPVVRMADLYLMYAEAVNEAYGPQGTAGGYPLTSLETINKIRARVGMPPVRDEYTTDKNTFRERVRNERNVELCYESNHYYYDIRRWKTAPQSMNNAINPLYGMWVEKCEVSPEHPAGRIYTRRKLADNRQGVWKDCMYYIPFPDSEARKLKNFVNNDPWR